MPVRGGTGWGGVDLTSLRIWGTLSTMTQIADTAAALGFSVDRLDRIGQVGRRYVDEGKIPFSMVQVARRGEVVYSDDYGWASIGGKREIQHDSIVRIYSMTKPLTSIALMQLYEQGKLLLEDPVSAYIPEFANVQVFDGGSAEKPITRPPVSPIAIVDLLRHTSGLTYGFMEQDPVDAIYRQKNLGVFAPMDLSLEEGCRRLAETPLVFDPGTTWNYSMATDVVGRLVEIISGQSLGDYFDEHILGPCGMVDTGFHVETSNHDRLVDLYVPTPDGMACFDPAGSSPYLQPPTFVSGGGGLAASIDDYQKFCNMLVAGGVIDGNRVIGSRTLAFMATNHLPGGKSLNEMGQSLFSEVSLAGSGFGLGFSVVTDPAESGSISNAGEFSWGGAASTAFWIDPVDEITCVFFTQLLPSSTYPIRRQLRAAVYQALND